MNETITSEQQALKAMTQADKYKAFRNFMANELGIGREDIKAWVIDAMQNEVGKLLGQMNITSIAEATTRFIVSQHTSRSDIERKIQEEIAKMITKEYRISVTPRETKP